MGLRRLVKKFRRILIASLLLTGGAIWLMNLAALNDVKVHIPLVMDDDDDDGEPTDVPNCVPGVPAGKFRGCMLEILRAYNATDPWLDAVLEHCGKRLFRQFDMTELKPQGKNKWWVPIEPIGWDYDKAKGGAKTRPRSCVGLTLGIGDDVASEKRLLELQPNCKLFGVDPIDTAGEAFKDLGTVVVGGVGGSAALVNATVMTRHGHYETRTLQLTGLKEFADTIGHHFFDFLWLDDEGLEYDVMAALPSLNHQLTICQINVEFHSVTEPDNAIRLKTVITDLNSEQTPADPDAADSAAADEAATAVVTTDSDDRPPEAEVGEKDPSPPKGTKAATDPQQESVGKAQSHWKGKGALSEAELAAQAAELEEGIVPEDDEDYYDEQETNSAGVDGNVMKVLMKNFLDSLPKTINRDLIDKAAVEFTTNLNTPGNRKKLVRALLTVHRNRLDLLPFYSRLVAVLRPVMPDVGTELVQDLIRAFRREVRMKNQLHIETKIKLVRYIGELVKFRIFPKSEALHCLKMLLFDFRHHNIDMACNLLDVCGYFLYHSTDSHHKTKFLIEQMNRKKASSHLDSRYLLMVDNAYFTCNPPTDGPGVSRPERPPMHRYIQRLVFQDIDDDEAIESSLKQLRKLDWNDPEICRYCVKCLSRPWNVSFDNVHCLASLVAGVMYYYEDVAHAVVDNILEDIRSGMEINDPKFNQRRMACVKFLGELYNYRVVDSSIIFTVLYSVILFGVTFDPTAGALVPSYVDPAEHLFRIRLACALLDTCGHYFDRGTSKKKLDCYLAYLQRYFWAKKENGFWSQESHPFPLVVENVLTDTLEVIRPKYKPAKNLTDAMDMVKTIEEEYKEKVEAALKFIDAKAQDSSDTDGNAYDRERGLGTIDEDEEGDEDDDITPLGSQEHDGSPNDMDGSQYSGGSGEEDDYFSDDEVMGGAGLHVRCGKEKSQEDDAFIAAFDKLMAESVQSRMNDASKVPQADFSVPVGLKTKLKTRFADGEHPGDEAPGESLLAPPSSGDPSREPSGSPGPLAGDGGGDEEDDETPAIIFSFMTRGKGNKPALKTIKVPKDSDLVQSIKNREQEALREKEQMKQLTLNMSKRMEEEERIEAIMEMRNNLYGGMTRKPPQGQQGQAQGHHQGSGFQHPRGAPNTKQIFGDNWR